MSGLALLAACATAPPPTASDTLAPNANLLAQGIPPIPQSLVERVQKYTEFRGHGFVEWHPQRSEMLVTHRKAGDSVTQIYRLDRPMGALEQLTHDTERVTRASYEPKDGRYVVFQRSRGGDEADQIYRLDLSSRQTTLLTNPDERHSMAGWLRQSGQLIYASVPLDRTAQGGTRAAPNTTLWAVDPMHPASRRKLVELPGPGWFPGSVSEDDRSVALIRYRSANESQIWLLDLASGTQRQVLPAPGEAIKATHFAGGFSKDGKRLLITSDRAGEFRELMS